MLKWLCLSVMCILIPTKTLAKEVEEDGCHILLLQNVAAIDNPTSMLAKGSTMEWITALRVDKTTKRKSFCEKGGYCYPYTISIWDGLSKTLTSNVDTIKFLNCQVNGISSQDDTTFDYNLRELFR